MLVGVVAVVVGVVVVDVGFAVVVIDVVGFEVDEVDAIGVVWLSMACGGLSVRKKCVF